MLRAMREALAAMTRVLPRAGFGQPEERAAVRKRQLPVVADRKKSMPAQTNERAKVLEEVHRERGHPKR